MSEQLEGESFEEMIKGLWGKFQEWLKPEPSDALLLKIVKGVLKSFVVLLLIALSPAILLVLLFVFFAAV